MGMLGVSLLKQVIHTGNYSKTQHVLQSKLIPRKSSKG
jgi:LacI family transcriptional regulator